MSDILFPIVLAISRRGGAKQARACLDWRWSTQKPGSRSRSSTKLEYKCLSQVKTRSIKAFYLLFISFSGFNSAFESVKNLVKPLVGYSDVGGERRFDIKDRTKVYFDIEIDGVYEGRINLELFDEIVPRTTENFRQLCTRKHTRRPLLA